MTARTHWFSKRVSGIHPEGQDPDTYEGVEPEADPDRHQVFDVAEANLIASLCDDGLHMPVIDLDIPCRLVPSRTPGHHHLYIDQPITWDAFVPILDAMAAAGLVEYGYVNASKARGTTFVRWKAPPPEPPDPNAEPF